MTKELIYMFKEFEEKYTNCHPVNSADQIDLPTFFDFTNLLLRTKDMVASNFSTKKKLLACLMLTNLSRHKVKERRFGYMQPCTSNFNRTRCGGVCIPVGAPRSEPIATVIQTGSRYQISKVRNIVSKKSSQHYACWREKKLKETYIWQIGPNT